LRLSLRFQGYLATSPLTEGSGHREGERGKTDKSVLPKKKKESRPPVAGGRDYAEGVSGRVRLKPSVCLEESGRSVFGIAFLASGAVLKIERPGDPSQ